ncbi:MAG: hypothetical protein J0L98_04850 [Zoogloea sp.]|nr:hypothetical protein [Zoogloea sp.]
MLTQFLGYIEDKNSIVMDFFAGSGTTGHAVMVQNAADSGHRRSVLVQLPEPIDPLDKDNRSLVAICDEIAKPRTIAELTKERLRRAGKKVRDENPLFAGDVGFRVFKLASSNIRVWEPDRDRLAYSLLDSIEHVKGDRTEQDILFELLLKLGLDGASLIPGEGADPIQGDALGGLARTYLLAEAVIRRLTDWIDPTVLHAMLAHDLPLSVEDEAAARDSAQRLQAAVGNEVSIEAIYNESAEAWTLDIARMHHGNRKLTQIDADFLRSGDYRIIRQATESISGLIQPGAIMRRGEKQQAVTSFADAIRWMLADVERGISKQRYKGLGEMNPEQLWETTMDPAVRRLLRVQIDDAIAADEIFSTLMGDNVEPRRAFIEENALYARNLDV